MGVLELFSLQGKIAVVTGGAGRLIGGIIRTLAEAGARVYAVDLNIEGSVAKSADCQDAAGDIRFLPVDLSSEASILQLRDRILEESGRVDILINAAVSRPMNGWQDSVERFAESMQVNATGLFAATRAFGDEMQKRRSGSIVNIASIHGMVGPSRSLYEGLPVDGFLPDYFFHKGGVINFTRFVASYYGPYGVRCNCISPGGIESANTNEELRRRYSSRPVLGRMGSPADLAGATIFLASEASLYITGANLVVDGGYTST